MSDRPLKLRGAARSDVGRVRSANEDSFLERPEMGLWVVADGMGGHAHGQWASRTIIEAIEAVNPSGDFDLDRELIQEAIFRANATIHVRSLAEGASMGSTVAALLVQDGWFAVLWVGDSRVYICREGVTLQLSRDHTQVQEMVDQGLLEQAEAKTHPMSHVLARAVGVEPNIQMDIIIDEANVGDAFLLCSDGLTACVKDHEIATVLSTSHPHATCSTLVELCLERGAPDNVTTIAVACEEITRLSLAPTTG